MRARAIATIALLALCAAAPAQGQTAASVRQTPAPAAAADSESAEKEEWAFSAAVYVYQVPEDRNYAQPTVTANRGRLHLEGRYNYEDIETGSAWVGYNLGGGDKVAWELTPMIGGVFGNVAAVAPGYRGSISWRTLEFSSEGEYVFGAKEEDQRFFYNWSELAVAPSDWWRVGVVTQRTRAYKADRNVQRGLFAGFSYRHVDSVVYVFNPDDSEPIVVVAVAIGF